MSDGRNRAERFFDEKLQVSVLSKEEFLKRVKDKYPDKPEAKILEMKGVNFDEDGKTKILLRSDSFPAEYLPYLETHEKWEAYVARKKGYNLYKKAVREYKQDNYTKDFTDEQIEEFANTRYEVRYDFRHEYAIYKEYEHAQIDGKLDEYHSLVMDMKKREIANVEETTTPWMKNEMKIRESIYKKLKEEGKHYFSRK